MKLIYLSCRQGMKPGVYHRQTGTKRRGSGRWQLVWFRLLEAPSLRSVQNLWATRMPCKSQTELFWWQKSTSHSTQNRIPYMQPNSEKLKKAVRFWPAYSLPDSQTTTYSWSWPPIQSSRCSMPLALSHWSTWCSCLGRKFRTSALTTWLSCRT